MTTTEAPPIYVRLNGSPRLSLAGRAVAMMVALASLSVLIVAAWLQPAESGIGTHTQMGFQPCPFLERTSVPCAGCGLTTSFSFLANGHPIKSFAAQPFGFVLAVATGAAFWSGLYMALTGKAAHRLLNMIPLRAHLMFWIPMAIFGWVWKIIAVVSGH
jgi:hypothetical protein